MSQPWQRKPKRTLVVFDCGARHACYNDSQARRDVERHRGRCPGCTGTLSRIPESVALERREKRQRAAFRRMNPWHPRAVAGAGGCQPPGDSRPPSSGDSEHHTPTSPAGSGRERGGGR